MKIIMFVISFLLVGALFIISENNLKLAEAGNFEKFIGMYYSWFVQVGSNAGSIAGYVIKMDWLPDGNISSSR